ncbi:hypothetical protein GC170_21010 [bacterium]|nr:hypothetical protein [bacterium]
MSKLADHPGKSHDSEPQPFTGSGRKFVVGLTILILMIWGALYLGFRAWKAGYEGRAAAGRISAARIRPLVNARPPGVEIWEWEDTVDHAEAMLIALTGSNLLSVDQIQELSARIDKLTEEAQRDPSRSAELLRAFWDEVSKRAGPVSEIYGRPKTLRSGAG